MARLACLVLVAGLLVAACSDTVPTTPPTIASSVSVAAEPAAGSGSGAATVRLLFVGDIMPARGVAPVIAAEGVDVFSAVRATIKGADVAFGNLEAALAADPAGDGLVAAPEVAGILAAAGFDVLSVANNHSGDAGSVHATADHVRTAGMVPIGQVDPAPPSIAVGDLAVAALAVDLTAAGDGPVVWWDPEQVPAAVRAARRQADLVVVSVHGGVELSPRPDPALAAAITGLAMAGADVVWAHGAHVPYPVEVVDPDGDGRPTVVAYGLGNFLFDQGIPVTTTGLLLEVLAGDDGVVALRVAVTNHDDLRVGPARWLAPPGDAVSLAAQWWGLARPPAGAAVAPFDVTLAGVDVDAAGLGAITGDPGGEVVVAFRRHFRPTAVNQRFDAVWVDEAGRSAHLGLYTPETLEQVWVAGSVAAPIDALAACDGAIAVSYAPQGEAGGPAAAGWHWSGFGFEVAAPLSGAASPACADVDGDARTDPVLLRGGIFGTYDSR